MVVIDSACASVCVRVCADVRVCSCACLLVHVFLYRKDVRTALVRFLDLLLSIFSFFLSFVNDFLEFLSRMMSAGSQRSVVSASHPSQAVVPASST
eukprot:m.104247 g.104247  ORF g.104247 m.104247 type:complete len:96 (+) comp15635_c0_seq1:2470-2757(+)